jgi:hypothetical protein
MTDGKREVRTRCRGCGNFVEGKTGTYGGSDMTSFGGCRKNPQITIRDPTANPGLICPLNKGMFDRSLTIITGGRK